MKTEFNQNSDKWLFLVATPKDLEEAGGDPFKKYEDDCYEVMGQTKTPQMQLFTYSNWTIITIGRKFQ